MINLYRCLFVLLVVFTAYAAFYPSQGTSSIPHIDKFFHFLIFFLLSFSLDLSVKQPLLKHPLLILFLIFYAALIEFVQYFLPYRSAELFDLLSDSIGILVYLIIAPRNKIRTTQ
tara:strand:- start:284 stop:628 length:345 start_codon:yes stop_codon:yes gene_type:complete